MTLHYAKFVPAAQQSIARKAKAQEGMSCLLATGNKMDFECFKLLKNMKFIDTSNHLLTVDIYAGLLPHPYNFWV